MIFFKELKKREDLCEVVQFLMPFEKRVLLVAKEAGFNVLKHAGRGEVRIYNIKNGLKLVFEDFTNTLDIKKAFLKGYSTSKTLGIGLNLILNIVDEMEIIPKRDGKIFNFVFYFKEKIEYCVFKKEFDIKAFLKVSPYISITTNGDCGIFEKVNDRYFFSLWDIAGHGSEEVYKASKELRKILLAFKYFPLEDIVEVTNYLMQKEAAAVIGEIKEKIRFFHCGNIRFFKGSYFSYESDFLGGGRAFREFCFNKENITFFSDGIDINKEILSFEELSEIIKHKKEDDAGILAIRI